MENRQDGATAEYKLDMMETSKTVSDKVGYIIVRTHSVESRLVIRFLDWYKKSFIYILCFSLSHIR